MKKNGENHIQVRKSMLIKAHRNQNYSGNQQSISYMVKLVYLMQSLQLQQIKLKMDWY